MYRHHHDVACDVPRGCALTVTDDDYDDDDDDDICSVRNDASSMQWSWKYLLCSYNDTDVDLCGDIHGNSQLRNF